MLSNAMTRKTVSGLKTVPKARDSRIDWLRGVALVSIFVNHMPGNRFENWTSRNFGFSDAAELFVLLAGVAAALAFYRNFEGGAHAAVALKAARRAALLYGAHLASTFAAVAVFMSAALLLDNSGVLELIGISQVLSDPWSGFMGIISGNLQLGYFNILPLYVFLLLVVPMFLALAVVDIRLMLGASFAVYLAAHLLPIDMPNFPTDGGWFFNPFAWQLIFVVGMSLGIMKIRGECVPWHPVVGALAVAYVVFSAVWMVRGLGGRVSFDVLPMWIDTLHKSMLPATRLLHILALAYLLVHSPLWGWLSRLSPDNLLARLGRNSLPVFVVGSLLSMVGYITLVHTGSVLWLELLLTAGGIAVMSAVASASEAGRLRLPALATMKVRWADRSIVTRTPSPTIETPTVINH